MVLLLLPHHLQLTLLLGLWQLCPVGVWPWQTTLQLKIQLGKQLPLLVLLQFLLRRSLHLTSSFVGRGMRLILIIPHFLLITLTTILLFTFLAFVLLLNISHAQRPLFLIQPQVLQRIPCTLHQALTPVALCSPNVFGLSLRAWRMPQFTMAPAAILRLLIPVLLIT
jgi:hypothetical protein